ncbi:L-asparaginase 1 [Drosophila mojavensis]|uniref:asparaginase n=1 Tax=Drosophila mojavensis TaxID=7230 RepID=B4K951_DROMO|nr:L-asparaginase 1 [Drosophila mojavensis]EDW14464.2 uncharacterized protein Dmoj_GI24275 [Drosophila mojavensis]
MANSSCRCAHSKESRILVIYTGGCIGMMRMEDGSLQNVSGELIKRLREDTSFHDKDYKLPFERGENSPLVLPWIHDTQYRVIYDIVEFTQLMNSSSIHLDDWVHLAKEVEDNYERYDGFIILHGRDTMAFTASALAFMLENLTKPVIITGSQLPIIELRTDGRNNFVTSLLIAGNFDLPEVILVFGHKVLRGCRSTKRANNSFHAFDSPNAPALGTCSVNIDIDNKNIFQPNNSGPFTVFTEMEPNVSLLRLYPGISVEVMQSFFNPPMKGVVIQSYGIGNIPTNDHKLSDVISDAISRGIVVVNMTQCSNGKVMPQHLTSNWMELGVVCAYDMTQEAALTKLSYVLGKKEWDVDVKKEKMEQSLRGELTIPTSAKSVEVDFIEGVARNLQVSKDKKRGEMCATFFPALVEAAIREDNPHKLTNLKQYGANLSDTNTEGRTALHLACFLGKKKCVGTLLKDGSPVDLTDRFNRTPLHEAIDADNHELIEILLKKGATLTEGPLELAQKLRSLAEDGNVDRLESYRLAGADLEVADGSGRTALHHASQLGEINVVKYLLPYYRNPSAKDCLGLCAIQYAKAGNFCNIVALLSADKNC